MTSLSPEDRIGQYERRLLAPYAAFSSESRGRQYPLIEHPLRSVYQRDRDRIIHSAAFRRMEYKTQVFVNHEGDHYRTRLTHTIEVAQISRTTARALGLNEDLAEAIALVHDLGHTPFGHSGEEILDELMIDFGGFNHNRQSLRVVDFLERRYPEYPGLNLTYEVREGIIKHETENPPIEPERFPPNERPTLEASLVDQADAVAYNSHDVDDGLASGLLNWEDLDEILIWQEARRESEETSPGLDRKMLRHAAVRRLVDRQVKDLINEATTNIEKWGISSISDVRNTRENPVTHSATLKRETDQLKGFLMQKMYRHPKIVAMADEAGVILRTLFRHYKEDPQRLHGKFKLRLRDEPPEVVIADFIAGMTDRYAVKMYEQWK